MEHEARAGNALAEARRHLRMTQAHLAAAAGVSERTVRRAERGLPLTDEVARSLCAVLGVDVSLLGGTPPVAPVPLAPRRYVRPGEVGIRIFGRYVYAWIGGLHPLLGFQITLLPVWACGNHETKLLLPLMSLASAIMLYHSARQSGCGHGEAVEVLQGKRFVDGEPVELDERVNEYRRELGLPPLPPYPGGAHFLAERLRRVLGRCGLRGRSA